MHHGWLTGSGHAVKVKHMSAVPLTTGQTMDIVTHINPSYAEATFVQSTGMQRFLKNI